MRLTKLDYKNTTLPECEEYLKLGELEDIEQELGIDLIMLFKALKNGFETSSAIYTGYGFDIDFEHKCIHNERILGKDRFYFKDYGKTWSLRKEDLEK